MAIMKSDGEQAVVDKLVEEAAVLVEKKAEKSREAAETKKMEEDAKRVAKEKANAMK